MLPNYYSQYSFADLSEDQKWYAYSRLRSHAEALQEKLDGKAGLIEQKRTKVDFLKSAREELLRQKAIRDRAGANARAAAFQAKRERLIAILLELEANRNQAFEAAAAGNWEPPSKRITAKQVHVVYEERFPGLEHEIKPTTVSSYITQFKNQRDSAPEIGLSIRE
jgi:hypothetical protein